MSRLLAILGAFSKSVSSDFLRFEATVIVINIKFFLYNAVHGHLFILTREMYFIIVIRDKKTNPYPDA